MARLTTPKQIKNPLTLIGVFAGLAQIFATGVLPFLNKPEVQLTFVWFVMFFPVLLVVAFFLTLNFNHRVLYSPSDWREEEHFFGPKKLTANYSGSSSEIETLRKFWKPKGSINRENERKLKDWLKSNGIDPESITFFLRNDVFSDARRKAIEDLGL
jgi:hypothetical protein